MPPAKLGQTSFSRFLRWWFYHHGLYCAKHPRLAAGTGIVVVLLSALGLLNPRGQPFVFDLQASIDGFWMFVHQYAIPRWHAAAYLLLVLHVTWATDSGVKYPMLKSARSVLGLKTYAEQKRKSRRKKQPWCPSFAARFTVGLCGVLVVVISVLLACAVSNSLLGVSMAAIFDELPLLVLFMGVQSVFSLLDASTSTYNAMEHKDGLKEVVVVDRVNQIALATSLTGPEELLTSLTKAAIALFFFWPLSWLMGSRMEHVANFWAHGGLAVLFKCLLQMSVFASVVQTMLPEWDPAQRRIRDLLTPDIKCRVCFESGQGLRRCPCRCLGSVGYIHPVCFQQWFETKKSMRCELCHMIFNIRMLPTSVTTNMQTIESYLADLVPPLLRRLALYFAISCAVLCNKLGVMLVDSTADKIRFMLARLPPYASRLEASNEVLVYVLTFAALFMPAVAAALVRVVPRVLTEWHRRHRAMHWDAPISDCSSDSDTTDDGISVSDDQSSHALSPSHVGHEAASERAVSLHSLAQAPPTSSTPNPKPCSNGSNRRGSPTVGGAMAASQQHRRSALPLQRSWWRLARDPQRVLADCPGCREGEGEERHERDEEEEKEEEEEEEEPVRSRSGACERDLGAVGARKSGGGDGGRGRGLGAGTGMGPGKVVDACRGVEEVGADAADAQRDAGVVRGRAGAKAEVEAEVIAELEAEVIAECSGGE
jgi:hypothetical protein